MHEKVRKYMNKCDLCHKIKLLRHKSYEKMRTALTLKLIMSFNSHEFYSKIVFIKETLN